jgi:hypothetical protein
VKFFPQFILGRSVAQVSELGLRHHAGWNFYEWSGNILGIDGVGGEHRRLILIERGPSSRVDGAGERQIAVALKCGDGLLQVGAKIPVDLAAREMGAIQ